MGALAVQLAVKYGPIVGESLYKIYKTWLDKKEITPEMWAEARAVNARPIEFYEGTAPGPGNGELEARPTVG